MNGWSSRDRDSMQMALAEAKLAAEAGEVPVGAVVRRSGDILARSQNRTVRDGDPTAHAEIVALRTAASVAENHRLTGAELFVSLEPCPMCVGAMLQARIARVVFAAYDERGGAAGSVVDLSDVDAFNHRVEVNGGLMAEEASALLARFFEERR
ncbi:MAG: tRNA adenosine(34) deaminase TadA [Pseudomonadota bacterium]